MTTHRYLFFGLVGIALAQVVYYYPQLPQVIASHFDAAGAANGWSSRNVFMGIYLAVIALQIGIFALLPQWSVNRGRFAMKIPNRRYWLAPERLLQTRRFYCQQMLVMGVIHLLLTVFTIQLAILANLGQGHRLDAVIYWALGLYCVLVCLWLLHFIWCFRQP